MAEKEQKAPRRRLGFLMKLSIFFLGLAVLCLLAALTLLTLHAPRFFDLDLPWFDTALHRLLGLVQIFLLSCLLLKGASIFLDRE